MRWLGHATCLVEVDGVRVLTDPVLTSTFAPFVERRGGMSPSIAAVAEIDVVLVSHAHQDHLHLPSLRLLPAETLVIAPEGAGRWLERQGVGNVEELRPGSHLDVGTVRVIATAAAHQGTRVPFGPTALALGYLIEGSAAVYFAGDTEVFAEMAAIPLWLDVPLDMALLPVGGWGPTLRGGHMDPLRAAEALRLLRPRQALPVHWGTYWPRGMALVRPERFALPGPRFREFAAEAAPEVRVHVLRPGAEDTTCSLGAPLEAGG